MSIEMIYLQSWAHKNFLASQQQQRDNVIEIQRQVKIRKRCNPLCLNGIVIANIVIMQ